MTQTTSAAVAPRSPAAIAAGGAVGVVVLGWLFPGLGYFAQRKWIRGGLVAVSVLAMFLLGLGLRGQIYSFNTGDMLDILAWIGDVCTGALYFVTRMLGGGVGNPYTVLGDYGSKFMVAAGLLNLLAAFDARDVALGRKK